MGERTNQVFPRDLSIGPGRGFARRSPAAAERLKLLADIPLIPTDRRVETVANELVARSLIPAKARLDALHVALAAVGAAQFLLTQNCRHIANAHTLPKRLPRCWRNSATRGS